MIVVDKSFKSSKSEENEEREERVGDSNVANEEAIKRPMANCGGSGETFGEDQRYLTTEHNPLGEW